METLAPNDVELEQIARRKVTCPFMGPAVRQRLLEVHNGADRPMAAVQDIADLGDTGGGDLGRRVLRRFAVGNHRRVPDAAGKFTEATPPDMMSLDLAGSQGAHAGHSGIMLGNPRKLDAGRFSPEDFDRLAAHADARGKLTMEAVGAFVAENVARDPEAKVMPVGRQMVSLFGVVDELFDSLVAHLLRRRSDRDEAELLERLTKFAGEDNLFGSAGEFGLLFAFFANRPGRDDDELTLDIAELRQMMEELRLPDGWDTWRKNASDWVHATTQIARSALRARFRG